MALLFLTLKTFKWQNHTQELYLMIHQNFVVHLYFMYMFLILKCIKDCDCDMMYQQFDTVVKHKR